MKNADITKFAAEWTNELKGLVEDHTSAVNSINRLIENGGADLPDKVEDLIQLRHKHLYSIEFIENRINFFRALTPTKPVTISFTEWRDIFCRG